VTKEDMDEYRKLNTNVVKWALAHSLMKVSRFSFLCFIFLLITITHADLLFVGSDGSYGRRQLVHALGGGHREAEISTDDAMDANKTLSSTTAELTRKNLLTEELTKVGMEATIKDEELRKTKESYEKALDQLKALTNRWR
jgi:hypothetical protein